jgi:hypothetical protein
MDLARSASVGRGQVRSTLETTVTVDRSPLGGCTRFRPVDVQAEAHRLADMRNPRVILLQNGRSIPLVRIADKAAA